MSQIANITVYDGASTPVAHTLKAISVTREGKKVVSVWREELAGLPLNAQVRCTLTAETLKSGVTKVEQRVVVPVMESISGQNSAGYTAAPKVAYEDTFLFTGFFHERSNTTGRRLTRQIAINLSGNVSTSVAAATSGPMPEAFDSLIWPT